MLSYLPILSGIESKFGVMVGRLEWLENKDLWSLKDKDGQDLGEFNGVVTSDKSTFSQRFTQVTGKPPPLGIMSSYLSKLINVTFT